MKKFLISAGMFLLLFCGKASAHVIPVTLSNGQVCWIETSDFKTTEDLIKLILELDNERSGQNNAG